MSITFKQYLAEAVIKKWASSKMPTKKAIAYLNVNCKDGLKAISNGGVIYRGFGKKLSGDFVKFDGTDAIRTSKDTNNLYQLMLSTSTEMKGIPDRGKSFICSEDFWIADNYDYPVVMIPHDGTTIALAEHDDFLNQNVTTFFGVHNNNFLSRGMGAFLNKLKILPNHDAKTQYQWTDAAAIDAALAKIPVENIICAAIINLELDKGYFVNKALDISYSRICNLVLNKENSTAKDMTDRAKIIEYFRTAKLPPIVEHFKQIMVRHPAARFTALSTAIYQPATINITTVRFGEHIPDNGGECWFEGKCVAISEKLFTLILIELEKLGHSINDRIKIAWNRRMERALKQSSDNDTDF